LKNVLRLFSSLKLAVVLLSLLGAVIGYATLLETHYGRDHAQWYVYHSTWFVALLAVLGVNVFGAALSRWPWKRHHAGFLITHAGLLVLLTGAIVTFTRGVDGQLTLVEGSSRATLTLPQHNRISMNWSDRPDEAPYLFRFQSGPRSWSSGTTFDLGEVDGVSARILHFYREATVKEEWAADSSGLGGPLLRVKVEAPQAGSMVEPLLVDQGFGDEVAVGPLRLQLQAEASAAMLEDFLKPLPMGLGPRGLLLAYYQNHVERIPVDAELGKRITLGNTGAEVELVDYLPNGRPESRGRFRSVDDRPLNPILELSVRVAGDEPFRQLVFARSPLLGLDPVYGRVCPVKFSYHHPDVRWPAGVEFMATAAGKLFYRTLADGRIGEQGEITPGKRTELASKLALTVSEFLPHSRQKIAFESSPAAVSAKEKREPAAEVELTAGGVTQSVWLQRNHPDYGTRSIATPKGMLRVRFGNDEMPLGFALKLVEFRRDVNPGGVGNAAFTSVVEVINEGKETARHEISMNQPLTHNGLTFYQSGFDDSGRELKRATFSVAYDPGRLLKYAGSLMICLGIAIMFYMRAYFFTRPRSTEAIEAISRRALTDTPDGPELVIAQGVVSIPDRFPSGERRPQPAEHRLNFSTEESE
jgi:hypothetical protein